MDRSQGEHDHSMIQQRISKSIDNCLKNVQNTRNQAVSIAEALQAFRPNPQTKDLLARIVASHIKDLDILNGVELKQHIQDLDTMINDAVEDYHQLKDRTEKSYRDAQENADKKVEQASEEKARYESLLEALQQEKAKAEAITIEYEQRLVTIKTIEERITQLTQQLIESQANAKRQEEFAKGVEQSFNSQNANQAATLQTLRDEHTRSSNALKSEKDELQRQLDQSKKELKVAQDLNAQYERMGQDTRQIQETYAVAEAKREAKQQAQTAEQQAERRCELQKTLLEASFGREKTNLIFAHEAEIRRLRDTHGREEKEVKFQHARVEERNQALIRDIDKARREAWEAKVLSDARKAELDQKSGEISKMVNETFQGGVQRVLTSFENKVMGELDTHRYEINMTVESYKDLARQVTSWLNQAQSGERKIDNALDKHGQDFHNMINNAATVLSNHIENAHALLEKGTTTHDDLKIEKKYHRIILEAYAMVKSQKDFQEDYRKEVDNLIYSKDQEIGALRQANKTYHDDSIRTSEKEEKLRDLQLEHNQLQGDIAILRSNADTRTGELSKEKERLQKEINSLRSTAGVLAVREKEIEELKGKLEDLQRKLDECEEHRLVSETTKEHLDKVMQDLKDCTAHRAINEEKAANFDALLSENGELRKLRDSVETLTQHITSMDQMGVSSRRTGSPHRRSPRHESLQPSTDPPRSILTTRRPSAIPTPQGRALGATTPTIEISEAGPSGSRSTLPRTRPGPMGPTLSSQQRSSTPSTPTTSTFPSSSQSAVEPGTKRARPSNNTPDAGRKIRAAGVSRPTEGIEVEPSPGGDQTQGEQTELQEDPTQQGVRDVQGALARVGLHAETDRPTEESHEDTEMADNPLMGEDDDADNSLLGLGGNNADPEEEYDEQAGLTEEERIKKLREGKILPRSEWEAPKNPRSANGIPSQADQFFAAIKKPANWDEDANKALLEAIPKVKSSLGPVVEEFHAQKDCMLSRLQRDAVGPPIPDDQTEPCANCQEADRPCFGARILPDTTAPKNKFDQVRKTPRLKFGRDADGYYWELKYRPARGPDDDATGGGTGGIPTA